MSKIVSVSVDNCISCPYCLSCPDGDTQNKTLFAFQCTAAKKRIGGYKGVTKDTPIPKWCPLPDGSEVKYFVVKKRVEDVTDDFGLEMTSVNEISIGDETYIMLACEKDWGYQLADNLNQLGEKNAVVILGRIVTEEEIDIDRGGTQRKRGGSS